MNILITGVAGLLGSRLADWIIENTNHQVIGIDNLSGGRLDNLKQHKKNNKLTFKRLILIIFPRMKKYLKMQDMFFTLLE